MKDKAKKKLMKSISRWEKERHECSEDLKDIEIRKEAIQSEIEVLDLLIEFGNKQIGDNL